jgi:hypothetical protein
VISRLLRAYGDPLKGSANRQAGQEGIVSVLYKDSRIVPSRKTTYGSPGRRSRASVRPRVLPVDERAEIFYINRSPALGSL